MLGWFHPPHPDPPRHEGETLLVSPGGVFLVVDGTPDSVALVFMDADRHGMSEVALLSFGNLLSVTAGVLWEVRENRPDVEEAA